MHGRETLRPALVTLGTVAFPSLRKAIVGEGYLFLLLNRHEPLHPLPVENLAGIDVAFRIDGDHVQPEELAAVLAHATERAHDLAILAIEEPYVVV